MLYIVSTPIGNPDDITLRALDVLRTADAVVCEERREGARRLNDYKINNELVELNEHTEREQVPELLARLQRGETLALISDHGTPLLADPGTTLVQRALEQQIPVTAVPGASSLLAALVLSGLPIERFRFLGLLPAKREVREQALRRLRDDRDTMVLLDAPYRLLALLRDLRQALGAHRRLIVACNLTTRDEQVIRGTTAEVLAHFEKNPFKGEFVIAIAGSNTQRKPEQL